ncbi:MAG: succinylglutamate desuccinylase/aspartoacylase family protein [marine benthic group bacterium]|jgi:predicted deacylase|nr:succinylglutamate desuccinylase/aspartoacylase family protein [Gemmatimonadota bacterium]MCL7961945.1 succinylglutamate desuccinylase/aspartoacylase family protein [Candidatus Carthagonibacter metallireducens]MCL7937779.1 succinylglutamate desuccinylase/aspartoacylase family protein [Gemmatimonadota bacterium]MCL7956541.1 succinylglutamate desuccinylase/aspartoacylase family protein [Gemmatimonadota bacterium]MCL7964563.1 succinylglutamate desuccinylase/aspartoacylase family protein [Gemmati
MPRKTRKDVGAWPGRKIRPGESADLKLTVSKSYSGTSIRVPVHVWRGKKPGPAVFIAAAVHGDELNGTGTIRHIIQERPFDLIAGSLVLVPVVNILAFEQLSRYSPDRRDLNRSYPGLRRGSLTSRLARVIFDNIVARCDYGIDLHTAAVRRTNYPNIRADMDQEATARLATLFGAELIINSPGPVGSLRRSAVQAGCATMLVEAGEVWKVEPSVVEYTLRGIRNVLVGLQMIEGEIVEPEFRVVVEDTKWIRAERGGFLKFHVHPGDPVDKGQPLATNTSLSGEDLYTLKAPKRAIVLGMTTLPAVSPGDPVAHLGYPSPRAFKKMERAIGKLPDDSLLARLHDDLASNVLISDLDEPEA